MNIPVTASAPGKLMLFGEHAVVYNHPCIVSAVSERLTARVSTKPTPVFILDAPDVGVNGYTKPMSDIGKGDIPKGAKFIETAVKNFMDKIPNPNGIYVTTSSTFSPLWGFGSSSASVVATIKALAHLFSIPLTSQQVFDYSYQTVLDVQKKGSGFDVASAVFGGTILYQKGKPVRQISCTNLPLVVGYCGVKADTSIMIDQVSQKMTQYPDKVHRIFTAIEKIVYDAMQAIENNDWHTVGKFMTFNQEYLRDLGVSTEKLESLIQAAIRGKAYGAKLSGAGGGDSMIAITDDSHELMIQEEITASGGTVIPISTNQEGVRIES